MSLGRTELELLNIVWENGPSTVADVHRLVSKRREVAYTTIMTVLKNLAGKGYLSYTTKGRSYVYRAIRSAREVRSGLVSDLIRSAFGDSPLSLALTLVRDEQLSPEELAELRRAIADMEDTDSGEAGGAA